MGTPNTPTPPPSNDPLAKYRTTPAPSAKPVAKKPAAKPADPWAPAISAGQFILNVLSTPMYGVEGTLAGGGNPLKGFENIGNAFAGKKTVTGHDILTNLGMDKNFGNVNIFGADINLPGLAADIVLDPLTYVPFGAIETVGKAATKAISTGVRATDDAMRGNVALKIVTNAPERAKISKAVPKAVKGTPDNPMVPRGARQTLFNEAGATGDKARQIRQNLQKNAYMTVSVEGGRSVSQTLGDMLASGLDGFVKGAQYGWHEGRLKTLVHKDAKITKKAIKAGEESPIKLLDNAGISATIAKNDAGQVILENGDVAEFKPMTPYQHGKQWIVAPDETGQIYQFTNEDAARSWIADRGVTPDAPAQKFKAKPIIDTAPSAFDTAAEVAAKTVADPRLSKDIAKNVIKADEIAKATTGIRAGIGSKAEAVMKLIDKNNLGREISLRTSLTEAQRANIKEHLANDDLENALMYIQRNRTDKAIEPIYKAHFGRAVNVNGKAVPLERFVNSGLPVSSLTPETRVGLRSMLTNISADNPLDSVMKSLRAELTKLTGSESAVTQIISASGIAGARDEGVLKSVLESLSGPEAGVKYTGLQDLITGLRAGHKIDGKSLLKIAKLLSPESKNWTKISKALDDGDNIAALTETIIKSGAVQTLKTAQNRLAALDADTLAAATNIGMPDVLATALDSAKPGSRTPFGDVLVPTRQSAADYIERVQNDSSMISHRGALQSITEYLAKAMKYRFGAIYEATKDGKAIERKSVLGQTVTKVGEDAYLLQEWNANFEVNFLGAFFQRMGSVRAKKIDASKAVSEIDSIDSFIRHYDVLENHLVATQGVRISHQRAIYKTVHANDAAKLGTQHYWAYINMGDFARSLAANGRTDLFNRAFMPYGVIKGEVKRASDWLSPYGIGEAIITLMEAKQKGLPYTIDEIAKIVASRAKKQEAWTPAFEKTVPKLSKEIAQFLEANIGDFEKAHASRVIAEVGDAHIPAQIISSEISGITMDIIELARNKGTIGNHTYQELARDLFYKYLIATDSFAQSNGRVAEAVMRQQARVFMHMTDLKSIIDEAGGVGAAVEIQALSRVAQNEETLAAYQEVLRHINTYFDTKKNGSELMALATPTRQSKLEANLAKAETELEAVVKDYPDVVDKASQARFTQRYNAALRKLDKARKEALSIGLTTRHWQLGGIAKDGTQTIEWVPAGQYDHAAAEAAVAKTAAGEQAKIRGKGKATGVPVDAKPLPEGAKLLSEQRSKTIRTQIANRNAKRQAERAVNHVEQAAENAIEQMPIYMERFPNDPLSAFYASLEGHYKQTQTADGIDVAWDIIQNNIERARESSMIFGGTYRAAEKRSLGARFAERMSARSLGNIGIERNIAETSIMRGVSTTASAMTKVITEFSKILSPEQMTKAVAAGIRKTGSNLPDEASQRLAASIEGLIGASTSLLAKSSVQPERLLAALKKRGINPADYGLDAIKNMKQDEIADNIFSLIPVGEKPNALDVSEEIWNERTKWFANEAAKNGALDEIQMITRMIDAIQFEAGTQKLVMDITARYNWRAMGYATREAAKKDGFVTIKQYQGEALNFNAYVPEGHEENLFHPEVAKQIAATVRSWNYTYENGMKPWMQTMMQVLSAFKATQTVLRPGHLIANTIGDTITAMMDGVTPLDLAKGIVLAAKHAKGEIGADWFRSSEASVARAIASIDRVVDSGYIMGETGTKLHVGGKSGSLSDEQLIRLMDDSNVLVGDQVTNDSTGLRWKTETEASGAEAKYNSNLQKGLDKYLSTSAIARGWQNIVKPAGDINAYIGNGIRAAHALKVLRSKKFASIEDARNAINEMINLYHPTIQSLTASERKAPRMMFSYYTWLRGAHSTFLELALNHTAAMMVPSKVFMNQAIASGQEGNYSLGNMWGDKTKTPGYLNYSVYGPTFDGPRGPVLYKPSVLPLDVLDTWNIQFDPTKSADVQTIDNAKSVMRTVGSSLNMLAQPGIEMLTGTDLKTGNPSTVKDLPTAMDKLTQNIGFMQLLKGMGVYTPANKVNNTTNPLTQRDRELSTTNFMLGLKFADTQTPSAIKNAKIDQNARQKRISDMLAQQVKQGK